jgi:hypothetical protein
MAKEKVIIFQGEDKFVTPRAHTFDLGTGVKEFVAVDGQGKGNERDPSSNIPPLNSGSQNDRNPISDINDGRSGGRIVAMPTLGEPDYCNKLQTFITTRGGGNATPDQIMAAHDMFKMNCREADPTTTTTTLAPPPPPPPPPTKPDVVIPVLPVANLGVPPLSMGGGFGGGGGGEEGKPAAKKKSYWWLLLVAVGIYYVAKKKN